MSTTWKNLFRWLLGVWLLLLCCGGLSRSPTAAYAQGQDSPFIFSVVAGFDGHYRHNFWFPVTFTVGNDGPDVQAVLEWDFPNSFDGALFRRKIDLPRGSRKQVTIFASTSNYSRVGEARLMVDDKPLIKQTIQIEPIEANKFTVGVMSNNATLLNSLSGMSIPGYSEVVVLHLSPDDLTDNAQAMMTLDSLFLHDVTTADLHQTQIDTLRLWVLLGGQLVVSGGINAGQTASGLTDMMPVTVGNLTNEVSLASLKEVFVDSQPIADLPNEVTVSEVQLRSSGKPLDSAALLTSRTLGNGQVIFSAFDFQSLRVWTDEPKLWANVLWSNAWFDPSLKHGWHQNLLSDIIQLDVLNLPSLWVLILFILGYILSVGPINFLILRRLKRVELAWVTIPVLVIIFIIGTYGSSFFVRGFIPKMVHVSIVQGGEGEQLGQVTTHLGLFSPNRHTYNLSLPAETLVYMNSSHNSPSATKPVSWSDEATTLDDFLVDVSSLRTVILQRSLDNVPLQTRSSLEIVNGELVGEVANKGDVPFNDALLVYGNSVQQLGTIAAGERVPVQLERDLFNFPNAANALREGDFDRQQLLYSLDYSTSHTNGFRSGAYLMAWGDQQFTDVQIDTNKISHHHLVLYIIRLHVTDT